MIIDTHAHYDDEQFDEDREEILGKMQDAGIGMIMDAGSTILSWDKIVKLTEEYPFVYGRSAFIPTKSEILMKLSLQGWNVFLIKKRSRRSEKSVWIIIGIRKIMIFKKEWFIRQLDLARKKRETGHYPQQGGCRRYDGDYERICVGTARRDTLLFILGGDGKRVCENGGIISELAEW